MCNQWKIRSQRLSRANVPPENERMLLDRTCLVLYEAVLAHKLAVANFAGVASLSRRD